MAAIANIILADGQATPVNHTFNPVRQEGDFSLWWDKVSGVQAGYSELTVQTNASNTESEVNRLKIGLMVPTLETASTNASGFTPGPTRAYMSRANLEFIVPKRATLQERKDIYAYMAQILAATVFKNMVVDLDTPY